MHSEPEASYNTEKQGSLKIYLEACTKNTIGNLKVNPCAEAGRDLATD